MPRFFSATPIQFGSQFTLSDAIYQHWCKVLRAQVGDHATLFDGTGGEYRVQLQSLAQKTATVQVLEYNPDNRTLPYEVTLGLVVSRGERMDYAIQKATEMGVSRIQLLTSERGQVSFKYARDNKKLQHWQKIAISSCEQCGLNIIPSIVAPLSLSEWLDECMAELKLVLGFANTPPTFVPKPADIALLVGAEGGLSPNELALARAYGFMEWTLGARVLRTETAPIVAMASLAMIYGAT